MTTGTTNLLLALVASIVPIIAGVFAPVIARAAAAVNADIQKLPHAAQVIIVAVVGALLGAIAQLTGLPLPGNLVGLTSDSVTQLINVGLPAGLAALLHYIHLKTAPQQPPPVVTTGK